MRELRAFMAGVQFLTRIPVPTARWTADRATRALQDSVAYFPLIGTLIGLSTALVILGTNELWPLPVAVLLGLIWEAWLTSGFHEDAVADFCDAFGGGWDREQILTIMKDSRVGTYGTLGVGFAVGLRFLLIMSIPPETILLAIATSAGWGRLIVITIMRFVPPLYDRASTARDVAAQLGPTRFAVSGLLSLSLMVPLMLMKPLAAAGVVLVSCGFLVWFNVYLKRRIGGVTGDCLGFACYVGQLLMLLGYASLEPTLKVVF